MLILFFFVKSLKCCGGVNMSIDMETFVTWAEKRFDNVQVRGTEVRINSFFAPSDTKHHLWCSPSGGKNNRPNGVYHCWKTDKKGTLVSLVMLVDKCDYRTALQTLGISKYNGRPIEELDEIPTDEVITWDIDISFKTLELPPHTYKITQAPENWYQKASGYLRKRKIPVENLYVCVGGKYFGRIIIPYYTQSNQLIYFNGRTIVDDELRYRGPEKDCGVGKEDVLFFANYPEPEEKIYLCEGEFDAISLRLAGLYAVACGGKNLSVKQAIMLAKYRICLALDLDTAGQEAVSSMHQKLLEYCLINPTNRITKANPPEKCKDWNTFLCNYDTKILKSYVEKVEENLESEQPYGFRTAKA